MHRRLCFLGDGWDQKVSGEGEPDPIDGANDLIAVVVWATVQRDQVDP
jgi:hypothetical protein